MQSYCISGVVLLHKLRRLSKVAVARCAGNDEGSEAAIIKAMGGFGWFEKAERANPSVDSRGNHMHELNVASTGRKIHPLATGRGCRG